MNTEEKKSTGDCGKLTKELFLTMSFPNKELSSILEKVWWFIHIYQSTLGYNSGVGPFIKVLEEANVNAPMAKITTLVQRGNVYFKDNTLLTVGDKYMTDSEFVKWRAANRALKPQSISRVATRLGQPPQQTVITDGDLVYKFGLPPETNKQESLLLKEKEQEVKLEPLKLVVEGNNLKILKGMQEQLTSVFGFEPTIEQVITHCINAVNNSILPDHVVINGKLNPDYNPLHKHSIPGINRW